MKLNIGQLSYSQVRVAGVIEYAISMYQELFLSE